MIATFIGLALVGAWYWGWWIGYRDGKKIAELPGDPELGRIVREQVDRMGCVFHVRTPKFEDDNR